MPARRRACASCQIAGLLSRKNSNLRSKNKSGRYLFHVGRNRSSGASVRRSAGASHHSGRSTVDRVRRVSPPCISQRRLACRTCAASRSSPLPLPSDPDLDPRDAAGDLGIAAYAPPGSGPTMSAREDAGGPDAVLRAGRGLRHFPAQQRARRGRSGRRVTMAAPPAMATMLRAAGVGWFTFERLPAACPGRAGFLWFGGLRA